MSERTIPLIAPQPPRLSELGDALREVERSGQFSNGGPQVSAFESEALAQLFQGEGACHAVANATIGLMLAIRQAAGRDWRGERYAMMPAFTFAATAHAAQWAGLTPLIIDCDPEDWGAAEAAEADAIARYGDKIAVAVPYATLGNCIDLDRYRDMMARHGVGVVVDAAASLGAIDARGRGFGAGYPFATVFSMHATKPFATAEGGLVYSGDAARIAEIREMGNFGFGAPRLATRTGMNGKLPEVLGVMARAKLKDIDACAGHRTRLLAAYGEALNGLETQRLVGERPMAQFLSLLVPRDLAARRDDIIALMGERGIGTGNYFTPHLGRHPHFAQTAQCEAVPVAQDIAERVLSLPLHGGMEVADVPRIAGALFDSLAQTAMPSRVMRQACSPDHSTGTVIVGGGPGGMALMIAAAREGRIEALARRGLTIIDRGQTLGPGLLGDYAITSDSTAETFLTAIADSPYPEIASMADTPAVRTIEAYKGALGVPLALTPPFLRELAERLVMLAQRAGAQVLRGMDVQCARRRGDRWAVEYRDADGGLHEITADNVLIATGGYQCAETSRSEMLAGQRLGDLAGDRLWISEDVIRTGGVARLRDALAGVRAPKITVVGGSTSALSTVALLLKTQPALPLGAGAIRLVHRRLLRPFYPSAEAAHEDGFTDFTPDDICPVSGFVYRLAGFRLEARELLVRMLGIGGRAPDPRVTFVNATGDPDAAREAVQSADVTIAALGYRPHGLALFDATGERIALAADAPGRPRLANQQCEVMAADGSAIPGMFGIGLAAGFVPEGRLGGEPSFQGKANGLWLWQNDVGSMIVSRLLEDKARVAA